MSYQIGDAKITKITETILESFTPSALLPDHSPDVWAEHPEWITSGMFSKSKGNILLSLHSWLVETPRHTILIEWRERDHRLAWELQSARPWQASMQIALCRLWKLALPSLLK
jgi:hypothetical protein